MAPAIGGDRNIDGKYYQAASPGSFGERLVILARDRIYADFLRLCQPVEQDTILDVGVSDVVTDGANVLERRYPHQARITAAGLSSAEDFRQAFPLVNYVQIGANKPLPFGDKAFGIATSNAVLEHVGSADNQARFVAELLRVAQRVFVSVPNRYFPVEHHTGIPLLHFWDASFAMACRLSGKSEWADRQNLILMSMDRLRGVAPRDMKVTIERTGLRLGLFSSNLYLFADTRG